MLSHIDLSNLEEHVMGAIIPACVPETPFHKHLEKAGIYRIHRGKVRDTYKLSDKEILLVVATDRVSIFDFVLPVVIPSKGAILSALTVFWLTKVLADIPNHLVAYGKGIDQYLPDSLRNLSALHTCAIVVNRQEMLPIECIVREYLTGSGWNSYKKDRTVCGISLSEGLRDGSQIIPGPLFTPTTKAESGHDQPLDTAGVIATYGQWTQDQSIRIYKRIAQFCNSKNLIFADTKFEFGDDGTLADEVATPDSSRFWDADEWRLACDQQTTPPSFDKQIVREWGKTVGINKLDPENPEHLCQVASLIVPQGIITLTGAKYSEVFQRLTDRSLSDFQRTVLC